MKPFAYHRPTTVDAAFSLLTTLPEARLICGGTDLIVQMKSGIHAPEALISLRHIDALRTIERDDAIVRVGAAVPLFELRAHEGAMSLFEALRDCLDDFASEQIRSTATLGGNICNASPGADAIGPLLVADAEVEIRNGMGLYTRSLLSLFTGPKRTTLKHDEIVTAIILPHPRPGTKSVFAKKKRVHMDLALVNLAMSWRVTTATEDGLPVLQHVRIAAGAVAPTPLRLTETETLLEGQPLDASRIERAVAHARTEVSPIDDVRTTADYRRHIVGVFLNRFLTAIEAS